ncbi:MAG: DEAD/DEAH box helicase family protein [Bacteroidales bacterium]|nr:DEAD/DEAH box helicase family protein [Bacteroidales bacterium]
MLQEAIDLQKNAIAELIRKIGLKREITFRAPTGSGKTRMMADFMNHILSANSNIVFIVSTLSKGNLATQNFEEFQKCACNGTFPFLNPHLISSEVGDEERLYIPDTYNVYVLARDLYKKDSRLKEQGVMLNFLNTITTNLFGGGKNKQIWLIKDECHQATQNLDDISPRYFDKIINFSATPNPKRGQNPDVMISDDDAVNAKLIKRVELGDANDTVEDAIRKFEDIKGQYRNLLGVNPCLIIQISNKDKAEIEWLAIERILNKTEFQHLKWMSIMDKKDKCKTNDKVGKLPLERWKDYAKDKRSTIDIIIFKMVISEGWDIPRACMLYQIRDTRSKQLDEQVMGRVRRNPRLIDFERLSSEAQELATTAWVWGILPNTFHRSFPVKLYGNTNDIPSAVRIKTTRLKALTTRVGFNLDVFIASKPALATTGNIFNLYAKLQKSGQDMQTLCNSYAGNDVSKWFLFNHHIDSVKKEYDNFVCDYNQSMEVVKDDDGNDIEVSFPLTSLYVDNQNYQNIAEWVWKRKDSSSDKFSFDSDAEREWASKLAMLNNETGKTAVGPLNPHFGQFRIDGTAEPERLTNDEKYLWGKNFLMNSEIRFEYYLNGIHASYPDFVLKDAFGRIHLFEVKSVNVSNREQFDAMEYKEKINELKKCYKQCSEITGHYFYLPVLKEEIWQITRFQNGVEDTITFDELKRSLRTMTSMSYFSVKVSKS